MTEKKSSARRRRWPWIVGAAVLLIGVIVAAPAIVGPVVNGEARAATNSESAQMVTAFIGDLSASASATGKVLPHREANLSLETAGTVAEVAVEEGDVVQDGDVLVQLDTTALQRAVTSAEQNLIIQEANLAVLLNGATATDLASAQASVDSASANLEKVQDGAEAEDIDAAQANLLAVQKAYAELVAGPDDNVVAQAEANLRNAEAILKQTQSNYDEVSWRSDIGRLPQALELEKATNSYNAAQASYNSAIEDASADRVQQARANIAQAEANLQKLLDSPTPSELAAAEAQLASAEAQLTGLADGATIEKIAIAEAQVTQARVNLEEAQEKLGKATLRAPFDGIVTALHVAEGEMASGPAVGLADSNSLEVVLDVDEVDIGDLAVGQPATISLETWPDVEIDGEIASIAPQATSSTSAIVSYKVYLSLGQTDLPVLIGMTANADLVTAAKDDVLLVPNQAITPDRETGTYYVNRVAFDDEGAMITEEVEVTIGLKDSGHTEITSGIQEGDRLSLNTITASSEETGGSMFMPQRPGGENGGGPFGSR
ncbi:MAG: efflux RND transporter periplasmic adaptor subunit [Chloroflexota bacterium]|nr:efflux RND transporter periplasmic adaptor subunit [Chloroflexota bacterium]